MDCVEILFTDGWMDGWMDCVEILCLLKHYFSHIRTIGGYNEMLCAVESRLCLKRFMLLAEIKSSPLAEQASA